MSKIAVVFDVHAWPHRRHGGELVKGINRRGALCFDVLRRAVDVANANGAPLIVAGDLIDSAGPVQPQFAAALRDTLARCRAGCHLVLGNHDMTADGDHSLGVYESGAGLDAVSVVPGIEWLHRLQGKWNKAWLVRNTDRFDHDVVACLVPFHCDVHDERVRDVPLLVAHFGVYDNTFSPWCKRAKGAWHVDALFAFMKERNIDIIQVGDWHGRQAWLDDGSRVGKILEQGGQEWSVNLANPLLDLAWMEERRLWCFRHRQNTRDQVGREVSSICSTLGERQRCVFSNDAARSPMPQSNMPSTRAYGTCDSEGELASQREPASQECQENTLPKRPSIHRGQHLLARQAIQTTLPNLSKSGNGNSESKSKIILQGGALASTGFDNSGLHCYGTVALWDTTEHRLSWQELPGPRFCVARSEEEERALVDEAQYFGHNLFLRRYYSGELPAAPCGVEAYEALPVAVEQIAKEKLRGNGTEPTAQVLEQLISEWLDKWQDNRDVMEKNVRRYL